jgi:hypothetical protein
MPVTTRSKVHIPHFVVHDNPVAIARAANDRDPITMEAVTDIPPENIFLHRVSRRVTHAYDAKALANFIADSGDRRAPLSRLALTVDQIKDLSSITMGNRYSVLARMRFINQCKRMPASVTRWQHLDWCLGLVDTLLNDLHGVTDLLREELFTVFTMIHTMIVPSLRADAQILCRDGVAARETLVAILDHYTEIIGRHERCGTVSFAPCSELATIVLQELASVVKDVQLVSCAQ